MQKKSGTKPCITGRVQYILCRIGSPLVSGWTLPTQTLLGSRGGEAAGGRAGGGSVGWGNEAGTAEEEEAG